MNNKETLMKKNVIGRIAQLFVDRFELTVLLIGMITLLGIVSLVFLPKESLPEIVFPTLTVQTVYPGANPVDVELLVTEPIEARLSGLDDVTDVVSSSNYGFSFITVSFDESVDIDQKKVELDGAIGDVRLPANALTPVTSTFKTSEIPLISLSLAGDYNLYELTEYAELVKNELSRIPGVENVLIFGGSQREYQVALDSDKLSQAGLTPNDVVLTLQGDNVNFPLGDVQIGNENYSIRIDESFTSIEDIGDTVIINGLGEAYRLSELGEVVDGNKEVSEFNRSFTQESGLGNSIFLSVIRQNRSDVIGTSDSVKSTVEGAVGSLMPADISVVISRDTAVQVEDDLSSIQSNALSGLFVVILVLFLFIGFRESLIVSITIPLTLLGTLGVLSFVGITLNTFAILGLIVALGLLVDNTIIVMENMDRLKGKGLSVKEAAVFGTNQVGYPIASATLTTVAAFFPLAILPGIIGAFINTIPRTIIITLVTSLILAVSITPSVYHFVFKTFTSDKKIGKGLLITGKIMKLILVGALSVFAFYGQDVWIGIPIIGTVFFLTAIFIKEFFTGKDSIFYKKESRGESRILEGYQTFMTDLTKSRVKMTFVLLIAVGILGSSSMLIANGSLKIAFFPEPEPRSVALDIVTQAGTGLDQTGEIISDIEAILMEQAVVKQFNTTVGGNEANTGVITLDLNPDFDGFESVEIIRQQLATIENAEITFEAQGAGGPPVGKPIEIKIIGDDIETTKALASDYELALSQLDGTFNIENSMTEGATQLLYDIDEDKAKEYGLSTGYIAMELNKLISGQVATTLNNNGELIDVRVSLQDRSVTDLSSLQLTIPFGQTVDAQEFITINERVGVSGVNREDGERVITLTADLEQGYNAGESLEAFKASVASMSIPDDIRVDYDGEAAGINESFGNLFRSMIIAIFLVFIILTIQFGSIKQPLAILMTIPMALIGVLYGLYFTGNEFGFYAFMALVSLVGIAVNDAIVLIDYMNYLRSQGMAFFEAIGQAVKTRFNPVLATTMTTIGGILPLSFKNTYYAQFGYALIFGLLVTTLMTLVIIPIMYSLLEGGKERKTLRESLKEEREDKIPLKNRYQN